MGAKSERQDRSKDGRSMVDQGFIWKEGVDRITEFPMKTAEVGQRLDI